MKATYCKLCMFAEKHDSKQSCSFGIPEAIKDTKKIEIKEDYNYIYNYTCRFGFSASKLDSFKKDFPDINIKDYILEKNIIRYYLVINNINSDIEPDNICNLIRELQIPPSSISILVNNSKIKQYKESCEKILEKKYLWKIHNFLNPDITNDEALSVATSTNAENISKCHFIWIMNGHSLKNFVDNKNIASINYIVNVEQPSTGILASIDTKDNFDGIFMMLSNYKLLLSKIHPNLSEAIEIVSKEQSMEIMRYDN